MPRTAGSLGKKTRERREALLEFLSPDRPVSVRFCMYTLLSKALIESTKEIDSITTLCRNARIDGTFDDDCFVDNRRRVVHPATWTDLDDFRSYCAEIYRREYWNEQPQHIECWLEKDTTSFLVESATRKWGVPLRVSTGYFSRPFLYKAARHLGDLIKPITIVYIGDHDPSGLDIERAARMGNGLQDSRRKEGLFDILQQKYKWDIQRFENQINWKRIGVTHSDFFGLPDSAKVNIKEDTQDEVGMMKRGDPRAVAYKEKYGEFGAEVEAIEVHSPGALAQRVEDEVKQVIDWDQWEASETKEQEEFRELGRAA